MKNIIVAVAITAIISVALTLVAVTVVRGRATSSGISDVESCRDALVEIDVICQSMPRNDAEPRIDRLLATPNYYRCGDPRWHDYEPSYVSCFANHERAKQIRTELDAWWSAHQEPAEVRLVHQDRAAANTSTPGLGSKPTSRVFDTDTYQQPPPNRRDADNLLDLATRCVRDRATAPSANTVEGLEDLSHVGDRYSYGRAGEALQWCYGTLEGEVSLHDYQSSYWRGCHDALRKQGCELAGRGSVDPASMP